MSGYVLAKEACEKSGVTFYTLNKLIDEGKVRIKETTDITRKSNAQLRLVCLQDIIDAQAGLDLAFIDIRHVGSVYGISPSAVRFHIKKHRLRWRRVGMRLQPCKLDLDQFLKDRNHNQTGSPKKARPSKYILA